ncbi:MAG: hypothetical protein M0025_02715 [Elusimicrobia bacterium]|nr:hypothetical protein [Elusimicrobiota bacterium]
MYRHTQNGRLMVLSALGLLAGGVAAMAATGQRAVFYVLAATAAFVYFGFRDLTVEVDHEAVRIRFGIGLFRKEFRLSEITSVTQVSNSWLAGWGIHYIGDGWLYNVDGYGAVELRFASGGRARIGTDEPAALETAIRERLGGWKPKAG